MFSSGGGMRACYRPNDGVLMADTSPVMEYDDWSQVQRFWQHPALTTFTPNHQQYDRTAFKYCCKQAHSDHHCGKYLEKRPLSRTKYYDQPQMGKSIHSLNTKTVTSVILKLPKFFFLLYIAEC